MTELTCNFCNKNFLNKYNLENHQKTALYCLKLQNKNLEANFNCEYCKKSFTIKSNYNKHSLHCKDKEEKEIYNLKELCESKQSELDKCYKFIEKLKFKKQYIESLEKTIKEQNIKIIQLENENKQFINLHQETLEKLASKAIENAGIKNTTINNKNQIYNALQPLTDEHMKKQTKNLTYQNVKNGAHGIAHFASNFTFKERVMCTDKSRLNFVFKNENDLIIKDPEGIEITKRFIDINRDEILRLVEIYLSCITTELMDDATSGDMYKFWAEKREEFIAIRSAVMKGNVSDNKESYEEFKKNFLQALSNLVPR
jgi:hypothetical protein